MAPNIILYTKIKDKWTENIILVILMTHACISVVGSSLSLRCFAGLARPRTVADLCRTPYMLREPIMLQHSRKEIVSYIANSLHTLINNLHTDQWMNG